MNIVSTSRLIGILVFMCAGAIYSDLYAQPAGGKWYTAAQLPLLTNGHMVFADSMTGYYIGVDTGYVTKDGAQSWKPMTFPPDARPAPNFLFTPDRNTIMSFQERTADSNGVVLPGVIMSSDMGSSWNLVSSKPIPKGTKTFTMWNAKDGIRIWLDDITKMDTCAVTHDGGKTFADVRGDGTLEKYISKLTGGINQGHLVIQSNWSDSMHGVISVTGTGAYPVLLTSDGGRSWHEHYMKYKGDSAIILSYAYLYHGSNSVWVIPSSSQAKGIQGYFFYYSSDFGVTWTMTDTVKSEFIYKLAPVSASAAWNVIVGSNRDPSRTQNVISYKDFSGSWTYVDTVRGSSFFIPLTIRDIQFTDPLHGWVRAIFEPGTDTTHHDPYAHFFRFASSPSNSVSQLSASSHLHCVPNPATGIVSIGGTLSGEEVRDLKFFNTLGKQCSYLRKNTGSGTELDVRDQPNGCYFLIVTTSLRTVNIRVIVIH